MAEPSKHTKAIICPQIRSVDVPVDKMRQWIVCPKNSLRNTGSSRSKDKVEAILVNIFAGINRCDRVAEGVIQAMNKLHITVPVSVRLSGTNVEEGRKILADSDVSLITADTLAEAAENAAQHVDFVG